MAFGSRSGSRQIAQGSAVSRLPQAEQVRIAAAAAPSAAANGSMICSRRLIRNNAARRAERGPSPGSLASSWIRVSSSDADRSAPSPTLPRRRGRESGAAEAGGWGYPQFESRLLKRQFHPTGEGEPAGQLLHLRLGMGVDLRPCVIEGGHDQILQDLGFGRVDHRFIHLQSLQVALAVERQLHHAAAGDAGHLDGFELGLHLGHLLLHLLGLFHQLADIFHKSSSPALASSAASDASAVVSSFASGAAPAPSITPARSRTAAIVAPGKVSSTARTNGWATTSFRTALSCCAACSASVGAPAACETATTQRIPVHSLSSCPSRLARSRGAVASGRNSIRPGSNVTRCTCDHKCERVSASRRLSNSAITSAKFCGAASYSSTGAGDPSSGAAA